MSDHILDRETLRARWAAGERPRLHLFYGHRADTGGALGDAAFSQFWPCRFVLDGVSYRWAEQWMMASKARMFADARALAAILAAGAPLECKRLGRTVRGFDESRWAAARFDLVTLGNVAKFGQDLELRDLLLGTGNELLVEAAPRDRVWGIGLGASDPAAREPGAWRGLNLLGFALVRARAILRGELPAPRLPFTVRAHETFPAGTRIRMLAGDLKGETGRMVGGEPDEGGLYEIRLESDGTPVSTLRERFEVIP